MRGNNLLVFVIIIILFSLLSCEPNRKREKIIDILEHDYSKIDNYTDLYKEFRKQKFIPCSAEFYAYDINKNESFWVVYDFEKKIFYVDLIVKETRYASDAVIQEYLNILDKKYGERNYEMTHISVLSTDEKFIREEYTKELPCWTSDKYKIYFYKYDEDPRRKYYPDGFIVKPL